MCLGKMKYAAAGLLGLVILVGAMAAGESEYKAPQRPLRVDPPHISTDKAVKYDYDIVYVRAPRVVKGADGKERQAHVWPNAAEPENLHAPTDLMLLHPDGSEEVLVEGGKGAIADPYVSFDAQWVYYTYFHDVSGHGGADVYKVHVKTRKTVQLTRQEWTPNTGVADTAAWAGSLSSDQRFVYNMHPCPLPGDRVAFVSNRDGLKSPRIAQGALPDYVPFDLTRQTPLVTTKANDQSGKKWDVRDETGLRFVKGVLNVEYHRDIRPIFQRSCVTCHSGKLAKPAGNLVFDDDKVGKDTRTPGTYNALVHPREARESRPPRYVWPSQSRNSSLAWKLFGRRTDGFPEKMVAGAEGDYASHLARNGDPYSEFKGSIMPPPEAVQAGKVKPLTDEDRRTILRWIDLGCPIDLDYDPKNPEKRGSGWMLDDQRPTLTLTYPRAGANNSLTRLLVGMSDYYTGLDLESFSVVADFAVDGVQPGENLAAKFQALPDNRWELRLKEPITALAKGNLTLSVKDRQGNTTRIERTFSVAPPGTR